MSVSDTPTIHPASLADAAAVRALVRAAYARWVPVVGREPRPMTVDYEQAMRVHEIDMMRDAAGPLALIETALREDHLWIENIAVRPDAQGRGLGRVLLAHAETKACATRRTELRLLTNARMTANVALYERVGYVITGRDDGFGGTVYMAKRLDEHLFKPL